MTADSPATAPFTPHPDAEVLAFLHSRRSQPAKLLKAPVPDRAAITGLIAAASRVPDHGKLEPWRFIVLERPALARLASVAAERAVALGLPEDRAAKGVSQFADSPLAIALISVPRPTDKVPEWEQLLSVGAAGVSLVNAALASGWGASWLTGWIAYDEGIARDGLGLAPGERVAGFVHIGTVANPAPERPRPDLSRIVTWLEA